MSKQKHLCLHLTKQPKFCQHSWVLWHLIEYFFKSFLMILLCLNFFFFFFFFPKLCAENRFVNSVKLFPLKIRSIHRKKKYPNIISTDRPVFWWYLYDTVVANKSLDFSWNMFNTKAIKVYHTITTDMQNYQVGFLLICTHQDLLCKLHSS